MNLLDELKTLWSIFFPKKDKTYPAGPCAQCGKDMITYDPEEKPTPGRICTGCMLANDSIRKVKEKREAEERAQIELIKKAIREMEEEKQ